MENESLYTRTASCSDKRLARHTPVDGGLSLVLLEVKKMYHNILFILLREIALYRYKREVSVHL